MKHLSPLQAGDLLEADLRRLTRSMELSRLERTLSQDVAIDLMLANARLEAPPRGPDLDGISPVALGTPFDAAPLLDQPQIRKLHDMPDALHEPRIPRINWGECS